MNINFIELAIYCQQLYEESLDGHEHDKYKSTLYFAIDENNDIFSSTIPTILKNARKCILVHERRSYAISRWHSWFEIDYINENGEVFRNKIDDEIRIFITKCGSYANQKLRLADNEGYVYYLAGSPWDITIKKAWKLYLQLKEAKTKSERTLISRIYKANEDIFEQKKLNEELKYTKILLEQERDMYKGLLDEIQKLVGSTKE